MMRRVAALVLGLSAVACAPSKKAEAPRSTLVIGLDISGLFRRNPASPGGRVCVALHLRSSEWESADCSQHGDLRRGVGRERTARPRCSTVQICRGSRRADRIGPACVVPARRPITDFNAFFQRAALHVKAQHLCWHRSTSCYSPTASRTIRGRPAVRGG